jgi:hypothetical protein
MGVQQRLYVSGGERPVDGVPGEAELSALVPHDVVQQDLGGLGDAEDLLADPRGGRLGVTADAHPTGEHHRIAGSGGGAGVPAGRDVAEHFDPGDGTVVQVFPETAVDLRGVAAEPLPAAGREGWCPDECGGGEVAHRVSGLTR